MKESKFTEIFGYGFTASHWVHSYRYDCPLDVIGHAWSTGSTSSCVWPNNLPGILNIVAAVDSLDGIGKIQEIFPIDADVD